MLPDLLGLLTAAVLFAFPFTSRRLRRPARPRTAAPAGSGSPAVPRRPEVQPRGEASGPFAYDDGVITGPPEGGRS